MVSGQENVLKLFFGDLKNEIKFGPSCRWWEWVWGGSDMTKRKNYPIRNPKFTSDKVGAQGGELIDVDSLVPEEVKIVKIEL